MRQINWTYLFCFAVIFQNFLRGNDTKHLKEDGRLMISLKNDHLLSGKIVSVIESVSGGVQDMDEELPPPNLGEKETIGQGRFMASYFFPLFPQFYNQDYNSIWNFLKRDDTIGYFLFESVSDVCDFLPLSPRSLIATCSFQYFCFHDFFHVNILKIKLSYF